MDDQHEHDAELHDSEEPEEIRDATAEDFLSRKKAKTKAETFDFGEGIGKVKVHLRAIGRVEYDALLTKCKPSTAQRADGATYDQDTFAPKLLERCVIGPAMSEANWRNVWSSDEWNRTELGNLFFACVEVCSVGVEINPT